ncbi:MAG TPA: phosphotransferase, partial [Terriglobales bacterium]|nr:phosphotransferase [Terriglobales bacterium]
MHELIFDLLQDHPGAALAHFPLDEGALVCLFHGGACPLWIAKTAAGEAGIRRLRAEAAALDQLEPWADILNIPQRLGWHDGAAGGSLEMPRAERASPAANRSPPSSDQRERPNEKWRATKAAGEACLVQSGVNGAPAAGVCNLRRPWAALPDETRRIAAWLRRFQVTVPPPRACTLADLEQQARRQAERACLDQPQYADLLRSALAALPPLLEPSRPATAIHGDFWSGNVLWDSKRGPSKAVGVIDWSGFGAGTALEDLLTWTAHLGARGGVLSRLDRWRVLFFSAGTARDFLRDWSSGCGYGESLARWAFYLFLLRRMGW